MKTLSILIVALFCFSFVSPPEKENPEATNTKSGYYIFVEDYVEHANYKYLVESKDSVNKIFDHFFASELALGKVNRPMSIYNLKSSFYIEPVQLFESKNGKTKFRHMKFTTNFTKKRKQQDPTVF